MVKDAFSLGELSSNGWFVPKIFKSGSLANGSNPERKHQKSTVTHIQSNTGSGLLLLVVVAAAKSRCLYRDRWHGELTQTAKAKVAEANINSSQQGLRRGAAPRQLRRPTDQMKEIVLTNSPHHPALLDFVARGFEMGEGKFPSLLSYS